MHFNKNLSSNASFADDNSFNIKVFCTSTEENELVVDQQKNNSFKFDRVFGSTCGQEQLFTLAAEPFLIDALEGYHCTIFAYGQTGSGKTFTIIGEEKEQIAANQSSIVSSLPSPTNIPVNNKGIAPRTIDYVFTRIKNAPSSLEFSVKVSYLEIYMERVRDLLNPFSDNLPIHEDKISGIFVKGLSHLYVTSAKEAIRLLKQGNETKQIAATKMNCTSSRSHSIFTILITQKNLTTKKTKLSKISIVDLAGSEKVSRSGASGQTLEEAKKINKSLACLGNVINALTESKNIHVPYRESKLTRILQESIGGNSKTLLIINISPSSINYEESLSTLRFGQRAKAVTNEPIVNMQWSEEELRKMLEDTKSELFLLREYANQLEGKAHSHSDSQTQTQTQLQSHQINNHSHRFNDENAQKEVDHLQNHLLLIEELNEEIESLREINTQYQTVNEDLTIECNQHKVKLEKQSYSLKESLLNGERLLDENKQLRDEMEILTQQQSQPAAVNIDNTSNKNCQPQISSTINTSNTIIERIGLLEQELYDSDDASIDVDPEDIKYAQDFVAKSSSFLKLSISPSEYNKTLQLESADFSQNNSSFSAQEIVRLQRAMIYQAYEFDRLKRILMQDLQDRCEKVVRLEMQLDETERRYQQAAHSTPDSQALQQRIGLMESNIRQMLQKQSELRHENLVLSETLTLTQRKNKSKDEHILALEQIVDNLSEGLKEEKSKHDMEIQFLKLKISIDEKTKLFKPIYGRATVSTKNIISDDESEGEFGFE